MKTNISVNRSVWVEENKPTTIGDLEESDKGRFFWGTCGEGKEGLYQVINATSSVRRIVNLEGSGWHIENCRIEVKRWIKRMEVKILE
tara:strand:+ start:75672 stop:75935 length:264 start_codon:yes stop_codon:yes gene_type:complete